MQSHKSGDHGWPSQLLRCLHAACCTCNLESSHVTLQWQGGTFFRCELEMTLNDLQNVFRCDLEVTLPQLRSFPQPQKALFAEVPLQDWQIWWRSVFHWRRSSTAQKQPNIHNHVPGLKVRLFDFILSSFPFILKVQYEFLHDAIVEGLFCGQTTIRTDEVMRTWNELKSDKRIAGQHSVRFFVFCLFVF